MNGIMTKITEGGRVVIPAKHRHTLGLKIGDEVTIRLVEGELRILTRVEALRRAQTMVRRKVKKGRSLVDELTHERRVEATHE